MHIFAFGRSVNLPDFQKLFESAPGAYLVLKPDFTIVAVSNAYLRATMTKRENILDRGLFEVFPDNPNDPTASGACNLNASLNRVLQNRACDTMAVQKYDIRRPPEEGGAFEERYWSPVNSPVFGPNNEIAYIIHCVEDVTELVRTKQEKDATFRLAAIVESSDDAIISTDLHGIVTSWNNAAERMYGYAAREIIGHPISVVLPAERADEENEILDRIRRGERMEHFETCRTTKDGKRLDVSLMVSPIRDAAGRIIGAAKIARDITEERRIQGRLRRAEERFRVTLSSIGDAVIATDAHGFVNFMNPVAEYLTGWRLHEANELELARCFKIHNEFTRQSVDNPVAKVLRDGNIVGLANHTVLTSKDGREIPIDDSAAPIRDSAGTLLGTVLVFRDISEQRIAQVAMRRLSAIVESSDDAIISKDLRGIITSWNEGAERIFGYSAAEMIGQSILILIPADRKEEERHILARLQNGERVEHFETIRQTKDGRQIEVSVSISPVKDNEGHIVGASKIAREITERKRMERELVQAKEQIERHAQDLESTVGQRTTELHRTIGELEAFSYSLSHDMRAPLRAMQSFSQIIASDYRDKLGVEGGELLQKVATAAERMDRLINDVLAFSRLSRQEIKLEPVDVEKLICDVIGERPELQEPNAEIVIGSPLPPMLGHGASLTQCISNLLHNAVKFIDRGVKPKVCVFSETVGDKVRLSFQDNGIGIDKEAQHRLFALFQRVHDNNYDGTGIGLAIVRKAVERMGGEAGVESEPGQGSRFWVQLRRAEM